MEKKSADSVDSKVEVPSRTPAFTVNVTDAHPIDKKAESPKPNIPICTIDEQSVYYDMNNAKRGLAIIFNHFKFSPSTGNPVRNGTEIDCKRLRKTFHELDFEVQIHDDLTRNRIFEELQKASAIDHTNHDCIAVIVLTHGTTGKLEAYDRNYDVHRLWKPIIDCATLVGKPKLFFVQACRGKLTDQGVTVKALFKGDMVDTIAEGPKFFQIPSMADLLVMYSTYEGYFAWRNEDKGSCFIQALCDEFDANGKSDDLLRLLTGVCRRVAFSFQSHVPDDPFKHAKKQMPNTTTMLTKTLYFTKKTYDQQDVDVNDVMSDQ